MEHSHNQKYTCPMHPEVVKDEPGKCPKCGMNLVPLNKSESVQAEVHNIDKLVHKGEEQKIKTDGKEYTCPMHLKKRKQLTSRCSKGFG